MPRQLSRQQDLWICKSTRVGRFNKEPVACGFRTIDLDAAREHAHTFDHHLQAHAGGDDSTRPVGDVRGVAGVESA